MSFQCRSLICCTKVGIGKPYLWKKIWTEKFDFSAKNWKNSKKLCHFQKIFIVKPNVVFWLKLFFRWPKTSLKLSYPFFFRKLKKNSIFYRIKKNCHFWGTKNMNRKILSGYSHFLLPYLLFSEFFINFEKKNFSNRTNLRFLFFEESRVPIFFEEP